MGNFKTLDFFFLFSYFVSHYFYVQLSILAILALECKSLGILCLNEGNQKHMPYYQAIFTCLLIQSDYSVLVRLFYCTLKLYVGRNLKCNSLHECRMCLPHALGGEDLFCFCGYPIFQVNQE